MSSGTEPAPASRAPLAPWLLGGSFALSAALALRLAGESRAYLAFGLAALVLAGGVGWLAKRRGAAGRSVGPLLALALLNALLIVPELGLRSAGFRHVSGVQFGYPSPVDFLEFEPDSELFWTLAHGAPGVNSLGFAGPEPVVPKPAGVRRILFLGDSCLHQGAPLAWPELALDALRSQGAAALDGINLSLSGYSTHQGRVLAERYGARLEPDLVVISYGWNDHWLARGAIDAEKRIDVRAERLYRSLRCLQLARWLLAREEPPALEVPRVPPEAYRANLARMVRLFRERGAQVLLVCAPTTHDLAVPEYLVKHHFERSPEQVVSRHAEYAELTRAVAREEGAQLFDLAAELAARPERTRWFLADGIHLTDEGRGAVAGLFVRRVAGLGLFR